MTDTLPPLPAPLVMVNRYGACASTSDGDGGVFTAEQMREYARAAIEAQPAPAEPVAWKVYHPKNPRCSYIGDLPAEFRLDTGEPDEYFGGKAVPLYAGAAPAAQPLPPVEGDILPAVGSKVLIHLASQGAWVEHTVVGYYVWPNHGLAPRVFRVFVRVRDADGYLNARSLEDIRYPEGATQAQAAA